MPTESRPSGSEREEPEAPERWSAKRKTEIALRLLRGEALDQVSRETQVPARLLEEWQRRFLEGGQRGLRSRQDPEEREFTLAKVEIGELTRRLGPAHGHRILFMDGGPNMEEGDPTAFFAHTQEDCTRAYLPHRKGAAGGKRVLCLRHLQKALTPPDTHDAYPVFVQPIDDAERGMDNFPEVGDTKLRNDPPALRKLCESLDRSNNLAQESLSYFRGPDLEIPGTNLFEVSHSRSGKTDHKGGRHVRGDSIDA